MMKRRNETIIKYAFLAVAVLLIGNLAIAGDVLTVPVRFVVEGGQESLGGAAPSEGDYTYFTDVNVKNDLLVSGDAEFDSTLALDATTTVQEIKLGSRFSKALSFAVAATTTPGKLFALQNTGGPKLCTDVVMEITTGSTLGGLAGTGGPLTYAVGTSTSATAWSGAGASLVASTTPPTSTTGILSNAVNPGTYNSGDDAAPWLWGNGVYILGAFDSLSTFAATSSDVYSGMAGTMYVTCFSR